MAHAVISAGRMLTDSISTDIRAWHVTHVAASALYDAQRADAVRAGIRRRWRGVRPRPSCTITGRTPDARQEIATRGGGA